MSSLALMRWLESSTDRYDTGMRWITLGRVVRLHDALARAAVARPGARILEIGCGTGAVTSRLVALGAQVVAIDHNPEMLEHARGKLGAAAAGAVTWMESTASEIDGLSGDFDAIVVSLCLSEMSAGERAFVLREAVGRLREGGVLAVADEVTPSRNWQRVFHELLRAPQALLAWVTFGATSGPIPDLAGEVGAAGGRVRSQARWLLGSLSLVIAEPAT